VNLLFGRVFKALGRKPRYKPIIPSRATIPALKIFSDTMILMLDDRFKVLSNPQTNDDMGLHV
jgi:hypothetical protein